MVAVGIIRSFAVIRKFFATLVGIVGIVLPPLFVSIDPQRDTVEVLADYVTAFPDGTPAEDLADAIRPHLANQP